LISCWAHTKAMGQKRMDVRGEWADVGPPAGAVERVVMVGWQEYD